MLCEDEVLAQSLGDIELDLSIDKGYTFIFIHFPAISADNDFFGLLYVVGNRRIEHCFSIFISVAVICRSSM